MASSMSDPGGAKNSFMQTRGGRGFMAAFAFFARSLQQVSQFIITILAARFLLPEEYGIYAIAIVFVTFIQTMTYTGFYHFIVTSKKEDTVVLSTSFWLIFGLATVSSIALIVLAYPIAWLFRAPELALVLILLVAIHPLAGAGAWSSAALLRRQAVHRHFVIMVVENLVSLVGGLICLWMWQSIYALVAYRYIRILSGTILFAVLGRDLPRFKFERSLVREATVFSSHLYGGRLLNFLSRYSADLLLGLIFNPAAAGLYRFGSRVATGATDVVTQPLESFALTRFGAAGRAGTDLTPLLAQFFGPMVLLSGGVAATIVVLAPAAVELFFQPAYIGALAVTYALATRATLGIGTQLVEPVLASIGKSAWLIRYNFVWALVSISITIAAAPFGTTALAWSQAAGTAIASIIALAMMQRAGISTKGAFRALAVAGSIVIAYGIALSLSWHAIQLLVPSPHAALAAAVGTALLLGLASLAAGRVFRVFSFHIFSG